MRAIDQLNQYVLSHSEQVIVPGSEGVVGASKAPQAEEPLADVIWFQVRNKGASAEELRQLVLAAIAEGDGVSGPVVDVFNRIETNYIDLGAWVGDQTAALQLMALGHLLRLWQLLTPKMVTSDLAMQRYLAGAGLLSIVQLPLAERAEEESGSDVQSGAAADAAGPSRVVYHVLVPVTAPREISADSVLSAIDKMLEIGTADAAETAEDDDLDEDCREEARLVGQLDIGSPVMLAPESPRSV